MAHKVHEGSLDARGLKFAVIVSRFNGFVTDHLLTGALDTFRRAGCQEGDIEIIRVPGSWEMPVAAAELARQKRHDAIVCLGCVVRGETPHFDYVAGEAAKGLAQVAAQHAVPVAFGVLTTDTMEQAVDRAGGKGGNKGADAAITAIEMANLLRGLRGPKKPK